MGDIIIKAEGLGKKYSITRATRQGGYTALRDVVAAKAKSIVNRAKKGNPTQEDFWALREVNFEIKRGEATGIIGRNGAGKSTLLKVLSRITEPTKGRIEVYGRIASLLEVGTGFHPELTGRENIYLNGAILGMSRSEIKKKFDEIVDFSGVERFLDTPVKRYSSGMYVRLAFSVAAHLEPEILVVDEVLAVGDAEFQKKCLGKMDQVSKNLGRTILFVSHNMTALKSLCTTALWLDNGKVREQGPMDSIVSSYLTGDGHALKSNQRKQVDESKKAIFQSWTMSRNKGDLIYMSRRDDGVNFKFVVRQHIEDVEFGLIIRDSTGIIIFSCNSRDNEGKHVRFSPGTYSVTFSFNLGLKAGRYELDVIAVSNDEVIDQWLPDMEIEVLDDLKTVLPEKWRGILSQSATFSYVKELS